MITCYIAMVTLNIVESTWVFLKNENILKILKRHVEPFVCQIETNVVKINQEKIFSITTHGGSTLSCQRQLNANEPTMRQRWSNGVCCLRSVYTILESFRKFYFNLFKNKTKLASNDGNSLLKGLLMEFPINYLHRSLMRSIVKRCPYQFRLRKTWS